MRACKVQNCDSQPFENQYIFTQHANFSYELCNKKQFPFEELSVPFQKQYFIKVIKMS